MKKENLKVTFEGILFCSVRGRGAEEVGNKHGEAHPFSSEKSDTGIESYRREESTSLVQAQFGCWPCEDDEVTGNPNEKRET